MNNEFDPRLIKVGIDFGNNDVTYFQDLYITASGVKYASPTANQCQITIFNLNKEHKNYILSKASPFQRVGDRTVIKITLDVGRKSYGTFRLFEGDVISCLSTQPPDIGITLNSLTNNILMSFIQGNATTGNAKLSIIAQSIATRNGLQLVFQATDKDIDNYSYNGAVAKEINKLAQMYNVQAYIDNSTLYVLDADKALQNSNVLIDSAAGLVGIPQLTQIGVQLRVLVNASINIGSQITLVSESNPAANGVYYVRKVDFELSNRDIPFWYIIDCVIPDYYKGTL